MLKSITPAKAAALIEDGAVLVDIREYDEHARERIAEARHQPLSAGVREYGPGPVVFHCRSGARTNANAGRLASGAQCEAYVIEGGLDAWKKAGLPVIRERRPIEIIRQVQIAAGSLVVAGAALGLLVHPGFYALSAAVGAGLVFAGVSGTCMMATLLSKMPWNRQPAPAQAAA